MDVPEDLSRCFTAGSRPAPDPHDEYLEREGFYRKHTPRDPSSLFRCISEQLFDTQRYFRRVREECCAYMRRNQEYFESRVDGCFDEYLQNMSHWRTRGTLLELRALAYRYQRNVILYEPYTLGTSIIHQPQYGSATFRVFVAADYHFDSVYTKPEIEDAAFCQSLVYESLYRNVFQLPDVAYAVEKMLHYQTGNRMTPLEEEERMEEAENEEERANDSNSIEGILEIIPRTKAVREIGAVTEDGREFLFDSKESTNCILEDFRMCHFHNDSFDEFLKELSGRGGGEEKGKEGEEQKIDLNAAGDGISVQNKSPVESSQDNAHYPRRREDSMLKVADVSCVRQLLNDGITPFPYKVAKALDPHIYRNIEFDVWSEMRKLSRTNRFLYRRYINVGDKCFIRLNNETTECLLGSKSPGEIGKNKRFAAGDSENGDGKVFVGYVQHIDKFNNMYQVYVEELREQLVVHGNLVRSWSNYNNNNNNNHFSSNPRNYTMMGLNNGTSSSGDFSPRLPFNGGNRNSSNQNSCFSNNNKNFRGKFSPRPGYFHSSSFSAPYQPRPFLNRPGAIGPVRGAGFAQRNGGSFFRNGTAPSTFHNNYRGRRAFQNNFHHSVDKENLHQPQQIEENEDDEYLLKKKAEADETSPFVEEGKKVLFENRLNLKELLCTSYYYAESAKYFQCQDIIAMPAFITGKNSPVVVPLDDEQRQQMEEEQRRNKENNLHHNKDAVGGAANVIDFVSDSPTENLIPAEIVEEDSLAAGKMIPLVEDQLGFDPQFQQQMIADPNAIYTPNGQFYAATGATGGTVPYFVPATVDMGNGTAAATAYYQPCYRNATSGAVAGVTATPSYYCSYVYNNGTGTVQTPYLLGNAGTVANGGGGYIATNGTPATFDPQLAAFQNVVRRKDLFYSEYPVNVNISPSFSMKGNDLPMHDISSLRFFYNLGVEYFAYMSTVQGAANTLQMLQQPSGGAAIQEIVAGTTTTTPLAGNSPVVQSPSIVGEVNQELRTLSIESSVNKRNNSTSSVNEGGSATNTRNSTPSSSTAETTATTTSGGGNAGRNFQGPGYRRPPFNNNNNNQRGGYNRPNHQFNNYRGGMHQNQSQSSSNNSGPMQQDKGKDNRGQNNYYNNYGYVYNRRNNSGPGGRFNHNNYNNNNNHMAHRKPGTGNGPIQDRNNNNTQGNEDKGLSQSPFAGNQQNTHQQQQPQQNQSASPAIGQGKTHFNDSPSAGQFGGQQHQQQQQVAPAEEMNSQNFVDSPGNQNQTPTTTMNYYGGAGGAAGVAGQPFQFSGPPPHLPPPFANNTQGVMPGNQPQQIMNIPAQQQQQQPGALYNSAPFYTYAYYPVDMTGAASGGIIPTAGDGTAQGSNVIIQSVPYLPPGSPYQNQHLMAPNNGQMHQQVATTPNGPLYYTTVSGAAEPGTPIMQAYPMMQESIPWSSTTGGTPGGPSGPSSGIGSTESSPPYGSSGTTHNVQGQGVVYANQSPATAAYNYSYPPPGQQQQQFWYPNSGQQNNVGGQSVAASGGGGGGQASAGTVPAVKVEGKP